MTLEEAGAAIGRTVLYYQQHRAVEEGTITGVNARYVFVRYQGDRYPKATAPELLELATS